MTTEKTLFEKIVAGEIPSYKVYEDENTFAFLDINPSSLGHTLVIPKIPFRDIHEMTDEVAANLIKTVKKISGAVKTAMSADGIKLIMNNGSAANQIIFHAHMHIIPRHENDSVFPGRHFKYKAGEAEKIVEKIRAEIK